MDFEGISSLCLGTLRIRGNLFLSLSDPCLNQIDYPHMPGFCLFNLKFQKNSVFGNLLLNNVTVLRILFLINWSSNKFRKMMVYLDLESYQLVETKEKLVVEIK